jgi:hypothetical protein
MAIYMYVRYVPPFGMYKTKTNFKQTVLVLQSITSNRCIA